MNDSENRWYESEGVLRYSGNDKLIVEVDQSISEFYLSLIPKYKNINRQKYPTHITVVRTGKEQPVNLENWGKYQGEAIKFLYGSYIYSERVYYWLNVICLRLEEIREELGLSNQSIYTLPPSGFSKFFHITIANTK